MKRLTSKRMNGIKTGYWSAVKKEELVQALAAYEDTGLTPEEIKVLKANENLRWIPVEERLPKEEEYILLSFANFSLPLVGRYSKNQDEGAFYLGDCDGEDSCISQNLFVDAWMPLPEPYRPD